jgi:hypothetical protein
MKPSNPRMHYLVEQQAEDLFRVLRLLILVRRFLAWLEDRKISYQWRLKWMTDSASS